MNVMTDDEVREFVQEHSWCTGIKIDAEGDLFYDSSDANCIAMSFPETPLCATYIARLISMLGTRSIAHAKRSLSQFSASRQEANLQLDCGREAVSGKVPPPGGAGDPLLR